VEEPRVSRLPPPPAQPSLGSLIPGARSNPPPANDTQHALSGHAEAFANAAIELAIARAATLTVLEDQLLDLAIEVASALIERELEAAPELHAALAKAALGSLGDCHQVTLRTSPDGFETICAALGGEEIDVRGVHVQIIADPTIPGLGCVVDGDNVRIDATVSERLRAVRRAFAEERRKSMESVE
jgi:flagellar biosynthesis/type III secretory pathway protein FliH